MVEHKKKSINDYDIIKSIGEGAFGKVFLAKDKESQTLFAIKALEKQHIIKSEKTKHVYREKEILIQFMNHPHIIKLETTFQVITINSLNI
jgi:serine/threonine protein kinase